MSKRPQHQESSLFFIDEELVYRIAVRSRLTDELEHSCQFLFTYFFQSTFLSSFNMYSLDLVLHRLRLLFLFCSFFLRSLFLVHMYCCLVTTIILIKKFYHANIYLTSSLKSTHETHKYSSCMSI